MSFLSSRHRYFVLIPLFAAFIWFSTLLAMLLTWLLTGRPKYLSGQAEVAHISDIGASYLKPLFVVGCCITGPGLFLSLMIERVLRHKGRLVPELHKRERVLGRLAVVGAFIAMLGLALLSGFDAGRYPTAHLGFLLVFLIGVALSAIFTVIEFRWLAHDFEEIEELKTAYIAKAVIGLSLVSLAIVFGVTFFYAPHVGGVIEWTIGFGFTSYLLTFAYDLRHARVVEREGGEEKVVEIPQSRAALTYIYGKSETVILNM